MNMCKLNGNSAVTIADVPKPAVDPGMVLIKTAVSVICGSEMHGYRGKGQEVGNSGHEAAGVVAEVGEGVTTIAVGDRVAASAVCGCGDCDYCRKGQYTWCANFKGYGSMHAEYFAIPARACNKLPDDMPWSVGVLCGGDGFGVPYHTSTKIPAAGVETVAIFGLGPIGLGSVIMQTYLGRRVIGIDRAPARLALATKVGAASTILAADGVDVPAAIRELTQGGADVCIEAAGSPITAKQCFKAVRTAGLVVFNGEQGVVELSPSDDFIRRDIRAVGSWFFHFSEFVEMEALWRKGLPIDSLITHSYPFERIAEGYKAMEGESGKVLIEYS